VEEIDPEYMLQRSFHQFQNDKQIPQLEAKLRGLEAQRDAIVVEDESNVAEFYRLQQQMDKLKQEVQETVNQPIHSLPFLQPGRLVSVNDHGVDWGWGVVVNFQKKQQKNASLANDNSPSQYIVDVLLSTEPNNNPGAIPKPPSDTNNAVLQVIPVLLSIISGMSSVRVFLPKDLRSAESRQTVAKSLKEVQKRFPHGVPILDPIEDMKIQEDDFKKTLRKLESIEDRMEKASEFKTDSLKERVKLYTRKQQLEGEIKALKKHIKQSESIALKYELKCMKRVLRRLGYTTSEDIIETKGRVACEINAADELVLTELMFTGVFNELNVEQCVALLSSFVFDEKVIEV
jgi:ATP-dependent RNA helicase DOB1